MLNYLKEFFTFKTDRQRIEDYLSDSSSLVDLENRLKDIDRGQAPWQLNTKTYLQGLAN